MNQDQMYIKIEYSLASLFGSIDPEAEKINAQESAHQFTAQLNAALQNQYPGARIEIGQGITDRLSVNGQTDHDECPWIEDVIGQTWSTWDWIIPKNLRRKVK